MPIEFRTGCFLVMSHGLSKLICEIQTLNHCPHFNPFASDLNIQTEFPSLVILLEKEGSRVGPGPGPEEKCKDLGKE